MIETQSADGDKNAKCLATEYNRVLYLRPETVVNVRGDDCWKNVHFTIHFRTFRIHRLIRFIFPPHPPSHVVAYRKNTHTLRPHSRSVTWPYTTASADAQWRQKPIIICMASHLYLSTHLNSRTFRIVLLNTIYSIGLRCTYQILEWCQS